jgi:hypothetical protein
MPAAGRMTGAASASFYFDCALISGNDLQIQEKIFSKLEWARKTGGSGVG